MRLGTMVRGVVVLAAAAWAVGAPVIVSACPAAKAKPSRDCCCDRLEASAGASCCCKAKPDGRPSPGPCRELKARPEAVPADAGVSIPAPVDGAPFSGCLPTAFVPVATRPLLRLEPGWDPGNAIGLVLPLRL